MNAPVLQHEQRQQQTLTPRLQQAVRLLQLSSLDFALEMQQAMSSNPFLEPDESEDAGPVPATEPPPDEHAHDAQPLDGQAWDSSNWLTGSRRNSGEHDFELSDITAAVETLREHLRGQIQLLKVSQRDQKLMNTIVEAIDDDGYLRIGFDDLRAATEFDPAPDDDELQVALKLVQSLEPTGVAARDLRECLLLQLAECTDPARARMLEVARSIVSEHLDKLAVRDLRGLALATGASEEVVAQAADFIRHLDPRPGWRFGDANTRYVTPDVVMRKSGGSWSVVLNPGVVPRVRLNRMYAALFKSHRDASHKDLAAQLQEARWTVRNVEQRFATIQRVAEAIVRRQRNYFEYGELAMKPLALRELADELGLHESTISRVTNNKYIATPNGVFELKYFLSRSLATASGGKCSATAIRGAIKDMIDGEDPAGPLSDAQIARLLARQGLKVARRTVTKYRQTMRIPAYELRRRAASEQALR
jgi:RNA polymerase sigma-54 factor